MSGLVLKLGPKERVLINGVVIENGDKRGRINILTPDAKILRLKDALRPEEANSPVRRVCYILQLLLSGDADPSESRHQILLGIEQLSQVFFDADSRRILEITSHHAVMENYYPALKSLRSLLPREERLIVVSDK